MALITKGYTFPTVHLESGTLHREEQDVGTLVLPFYEHHQMSVS